MKKHNFYSSFPFPWPTVSFFEMSSVLQTLVTWQGCAGNIGPCLCHFAGPVGPFDLWLLPFFPSLRDLVFLLVALVQCLLCQQNDWPRCLDIMPDTQKQLVTPWGGGHSMFLPGIVASYPSLSDKIKSCSGLFTSLCLLPKQTLCTPTISTYLTSC